ncbi:unnamed protein product [Closterium sp. NIES-54]
MRAHPPTDTTTPTVPLLTAVDDPADEDVVEVLLPPPVLAPPFPVADRPASTPVSATGDEGSLEASLVAPASGIAGDRQGAKLVDQDEKLSTVGEHQTGEPDDQEASPGVQSTGELTKLAEDLAVDEEKELSAGEESTVTDVVEVPITKPELRRTGRARRPPEQLSFHTCLPPAAFTTVYDDVDDNAKEDEELPELDPDVPADPEHRWDIATMTVKEALASWKGAAVRAAMEEEIHSLTGMGTWELVEPSREVNIMKKRWVLTTKYRIDDTDEREKARLVVKDFTQVCGADYDETYSPNAFLQSKLDMVLYMYQPDYFDDGTGRVCKLLKSLYWLKHSPLLWYRALDGVLLDAGWKKSQVDEALYFKASDDGVTCWVLVYVDDLLAASSSPVMLKELKGLLEAAFELRVESLELIGCGRRRCGRQAEPNEHRRLRVRLRRGRRLLVEFVHQVCNIVINGIGLLDAGKPTILRVDNKSAITVAEGLGLTGNLKHMERCYASLQHMVRCGKFILRYIPTTEQPVDFLPKALHFLALNRCSVAIGQDSLADIGNGDDDAQQ